MTTPAPDALARGRDAGGVHLFGAGGFARDVARALAARGVRVAALLTSATPAAAVVDGLPCRALAPGDLEALPLWVAVFNHQAASDYGRLQQWLAQRGDTSNVVWPQAWYAALAPQLGWRFWLEAPQRYAGAEAEIAALHAALDDDTSRAALEAIVAFRRHAHHQPPVPVDEPQYAPRWLREHLGGRALAVVDAGAYQGETLRELSGLLNIARAWAFEPDATNFAALQRAVAKRPGGHVQPVAAGLSARAGTLAFSGGEGASSHVVARAADATAPSAASIPVVALDEHLAGERVDFLKLDVEGHEAEALAGARETIRRWRPVLAIAAYHRWDDLWTLARTVRAIEPGYRLRIGVHQHNSFDTVLYAFH